MENNTENTEKENNRTVEMVQVDKLDLEILKLEAEGFRHLKSLGGIEQRLNEITVNVERLRQEREDRLKPPKEKPGEIQPTET